MVTIVTLLAHWSVNCQEEGISGGAKAPTLPAALRGLEAPELETKIGQMVQGGPKGWGEKELAWNGLAIFHHLSSSFIIFHHLSSDMFTFGTIQQLCWII